MKTICVRLSVGSCSSNGESSLPEKHAAGNSNPNVKMIRQTVRRGFGTIAGLLSKGG
jgi:hypothetical protein